MNKPTASNRSSDPVSQLPPNVGDDQTGTKPIQSLARSDTPKPSSAETLSNLAEQLWQDATLDAAAYVARSDTRQYGE